MTSTRTEQQRERQRVYRARHKKTEKGKASEARYQANKIDRHPERRKARLLVKTEIRAGRMVRGSCEVCGQPNAQAHHDDYSKPLEVRWLCWEHHKAEHLDMS